MKLKIVIIALCAIICINHSYGQKAVSKVDTLRYKSVGRVRDTMYTFKERIKKNKYKLTNYYGLHDNTNLSNTIDTFIISEPSWLQVYNKEAIFFLSVKDFDSQIPSYQYYNRKNSSEHLRYTPLKKIEIENITFYLYTVDDMSGDYISESLGEGPHYVIFNFTIGKIYESSYHIEKVLEGYEKYVPYFKW
jgi:hypothetical protein